MSLKRWHWRLAWLLAAALAAAAFFGLRYYRSTGPMTTILNDSGRVVDCRANVRELCRGTVRIEVFRQLTPYDGRRMALITDPGDIATFLNTLNFTATWLNRNEKEFDSAFYEVRFQRRFRKPVSLQYRPDWGFIRVLGLDAPAPPEFDRRMEPYVDKPAPILQH